MEPFIPIPGKPPRQVVIDRQRKLFASLNIDELLLELVPHLNFNSYYRASTIQIHRKIKLTGFPLSLLMIQNTIADYLKNGLNTEKTQLLEDLAQFQAKACGTMMKVEAIGDQYSSMPMIQIVMYTQVLGMMIKMVTVN